MHHRIRAAALVIRQNRLLVVKEQMPGSGPVWWCPPGGGLEGAESVFEAARREVREETGLAVRPERIVYLREFVEPTRQTHHLELFLLASFPAGATGEIADRSILDPQLARDYEFMTRDDLQSVTVYPEMLQAEFWDDLHYGFPTTKYLGLQREP